MPPASERPIGELLVDIGLVTQAQVDAALAAQRREGGALGRHLILSGAVTRLELYAALAVQWQAPLVNLIEQPSDPALVRRVPPEVGTDEGWLPWREVDGRVVIATCVAPTAHLRAHAAHLLGVPDVDVRTTTDWDIVQSTQTLFRAALRDAAADGFALRVPSLSAREGLTAWQRWAPRLLLVGALLGAVVAPRMTIIVVMTAANVVFFINVAFKVLTAVRAPLVRHRQAQWRRDVIKARRRLGMESRPWASAGADLPIFTILIPAYREANVIERVIETVGALDYPPAKLDVLVLLEEDDIATITAARQMHPPEYVRILEVPRGSPQTKPRACNYGLMFARGEYVVIYDAEDRPEAGQLRTALEAFQRDDFERHHGAQRKQLVCVQAALNYFNADYNVLTRMFAVEYAHWFDLMLPGMDGLHLPIPLGGTSNHFRREALERVGGWDPYNVTEDADLGLRIDALGYRVGVIDSTTWEEATPRIRPWIRQRTRWIKGYMMTAAVNMRQPWRWLDPRRWRSALTLFGLVLGTPAAFLAYPVAVGFTIATYIGVRAGSLHLPEWLLVGGTINMVGANIAMIVVAGIAAWRRYSWRIAVFAVFSPVYWFLHAYAAWRALWQVLRDPFEWEKTPHGLTEAYQSAVGNQEIANWPETSAAEKASAETGRP